MAKDTSTTKSTKTATKDATNKTKKTTKSDKKAPDAAEKPKREPSAYNKFVKENMKPWREANPDKTAKDAMAAVAGMWRDAPENPNRGKSPKKRQAKKEQTLAKDKPKSTKSDSKTKPMSSSVKKPKSAAPPPSDESEADEEEEEGSDTNQLVSSDA
ncbi:hypothetical protein MIND_00294800 [Mycena indigotica]|uniref:HMG box domain-containing protein n=1 Tax=Mycena indigotica TaxID=2126181 RepID=A0A8H6SZN3_9AGAR|nr:uncharacterized protein MIND_00294800 [Mycena indigotica]KAF7309245.1 hypothetical protein MIND_00294800 [Mycena indigotica]